MTVRIEWAPVDDIGPSPCAVPLGVVEFKPLPNRTVGKGRWIKTRHDLLGNVLREELISRVKGPPINLFSPAGIAALIAEFPWHPITVLSRNELEEAKIQFIRDHPELHTNLTELAKAMIHAGLYSQGTQPYSVKKTAAKFLANIR